MSSKLTHSGNIIIAGFGMMILFMCFLVYKSMHNETQMVSDNYYESELKFQDNINAAKNADAYGTAFSFSLDGNILHFQIPSELNAVMQDAVLNVYCISNKAEDKKLNFKKEATARYSIDASAWKKLSYTAKLSFTANGKSYYKEFPVVLK
jgi:nitrogen fixation protein FixH